MAWNDQNTPVAGPAPAYGPQVANGIYPPAPVAAAPPVGVAPAYGAYAPSVQTAAPAGAYANPAAQGVPAVAPPPAASPYYGQQPSAAAGQPPSQPVGGPLQAAPVPEAESERPDADDDIWITRTKRAIAETQNDPFRQVQLLQHLNKLYLKERFGREVQADKG